MIGFAASSVLRDTAGDAVIDTTSEVPEDGGGATYPDDETEGEALTGITTGCPV